MKLIWVDDLRVVFFVALMLMLAFGCSDSSDNDIGGGDEDTSSGEDIPIADGDGEIGEEIEGADDEMEGELAPEGTKCEINRHNPDRDIVAKDDPRAGIGSGGRAQYCDPESELDGTAVKIEPNSLLEDIHITISLADEDVAKEGWIPVGPAVRFDATSLNPGGQVLLEDDATYTLPFNPDELAEEVWDYHINVLVQLDETDGVTNGEDNAPYFIPKTETSIQIDREKGLLTFLDIHFGTYQAVIPAQIEEPITRRFTYRGFAGISMGAGGTANIAFKYPEMFDIVGPMGGIIFASALVDMIYNYHLGGFCSYEEITKKQVDGEWVDKTPEEIDAFVTDIHQECGYCGYVPVPDQWSEPIEKCYLTKPDEMWSYFGSEYPELPAWAQNDMHAQGFNHWYYDSNGGDFDRNSYTQIFKDLTLTSGALSGYNPDSPYLGAGLYGERLQRYLTDVYNVDMATGCANLGEWMAEDPLLNFCDREYNPDCSYPVIYFCDGDSKPKHDPYSGSWLVEPDPETGELTPTDPGARSKRLNFALAVDYNGNGLRDYGEPVVRQFWEPFEDCGADALCNVDEEGYDETLNPDPAGDDYSPYENAGGTEGNGLWDEGESFENVGLDGVADTCPNPEDLETCPYDYGEGNGTFDYAPGVQRFLDRDPRLNILKMETDDLLRMNFWIDAGIRDIFNFVVMADDMAGALDYKLSPLGRPTGWFNRFTSLMQPSPDYINDFRFLKVDYGKLGQNVHVRYGDYTADDTMIQQGDGRHVGYPSQVVFRVQTFYAFANAHFPNGDYTPVENYSATDLMSNFRFYSESLQRSQKYSITLPPGYFTNNEDKGDGEPDVCVDRYPVIYLGHGYGMKPEDLAPAIGILFGSMADGTFQKIITVFPDGKCLTPDVCRDNCRKIDCANMPSAEREECLANCYAERDCENVHEECIRGTFYSNHVATVDNPTGSFDEGGFKPAQIQDSLIDLIDYVDANFCTKPAEEVLVDGETRDGLY